jgi:hypothetical protein
LGIDYPSRLGYSDIRRTDNKMKNSKRQIADRKLINENFGKIVRYKATNFKVGEVSSLGGFYINAIESTKHCVKGSGQYVNHATLLRLLRERVIA